ncbi:MAG: hypothetical protein AAGJ35_10785, partial [Myxococcota bacterium]
ENNGEVLCGQRCVRLGVNHEHCGSCFSSCKDSEYCIEGVCRLSCTKEEIVCSEKCINPQTDPANCGACGAICGSGVCQMGRCVLHAEQVKASETRICMLSKGRLKCLGKTWEEDSLAFVRFGQAKFVDFQGVKVHTFSLSGSNICVILESGNLHCWGDNFLGQLGLGDTRTRVQPDRVPLNFQGKKVLQGLIGPDYSFSTSGCAVLEDDTLRCWGFGLLGYPDNKARNKPDARAIDLWGKRVLQIAIGVNALCALLEDRRQPRRGGGIQFFLRCESIESGLWRLTSTYRATNTGRGCPGYEYLEGCNAACSCVCLA